MNMRVDRPYLPRPQHWDKGPTLVCGIRFWEKNTPYFKNLTLCHASGRLAWANSTLTHIIDTL